MYRCCCLISFLLSLSHGLQYVSPALVRAQGTELAVPGTYIAGEPLVTISAFAPQLHVISSKQRPRKLSIMGSDGAEYMFLLKGEAGLKPVVAHVRCSLLRHEASYSIAALVQWLNSTSLPCPYTTTT